MYKYSKFAAFLFLSTISLCSAYADDKSAQKVTSITIPQERIDLRVKMVSAQQGRPDTPELRKAVRDDLINIELMSQEALKNGLDKQSDTIQQLELARQSVLVNAYVQDYVKTHPVSEEAIEKEYDNWKNSLGTKEYSVRHILVDTESEARSIALKLKKGGKQGNFEKLAKDHSIDPGSKEHGGDLGWIPVGNIPKSFVKPFADTLMTLSNGQVSAPIQSRFGWHIIKLENVRDIKVPSLDDIKVQLVQGLQQKAVKQMVDDLRTKAKIE